MTHPKLTPTLKPCPLCGSNFKMGQEPHDNHPVGGMFYIYHEYGPIGSAARKCPLSVDRHFDSGEEAAIAWNRRSDAELSTLRKLERAEKALEPFIAFASLPGFDRLPDDLQLTNGSRIAARQLTVADFRALSKAGEVKP